MPNSDVERETRDGACKGNENYRKKLVSSGPTNQDWRATKEDKDARSSNSSYSKSYLNPCADSFEPLNAENQEKVTEWASGTLSNNCLGLDKSQYKGWKSWLKKTKAELTETGLVSDELSFRNFYFGSSEESKLYRLFAACAMKGPHYVDQCLIKHLEEPEITEFETNFVGSEFQKFQSHERDSASEDIQSEKGDRALENVRNEAQDSELESGQDDDKYSAFQWTQDDEHSILQGTQDEKEDSSSQNFQDGEEYSPLEHIDYGRRSNPKSVQ